jgi:hypothetical protein
LRFGLAGRRVEGIVFFSREITCDVLVENAERSENKTRRLLNLSIKITISNGRQPRWPQKLHCSGKSEALRSILI